MHYCSRHHQKLDWKLRHKAACSALQAQQAQTQAQTQAAATTIITGSGSGFDSLVRPVGIYPEYDLVVEEESLDDRAPAPATSSSSSSSAALSAEASSPSMRTSAAEYLKTVNIWEDAYHVPGMTPSVIQQSAEPDDVCVLL